MSSELVPRTNRLTGRSAVGNEPAILGIVSISSTDASEDADKSEVLTDDNARLAALPIRSALCELIDEWEERRRRGEPLHVLRRETSHVSRDSGGLYDLNEFEKTLQAELDHLTWICLRPLQDLRYDETIQPVGRVRRPARGAAQQLSAHSEQWERWDPDFPIPKEILASIRDDDTDLYENRVVRTLTKGAVVHISRRLQELRSHLTKNLQGRHVLLTGWHWRQERLRASFDAQDVDAVIEMLQLAVAELETMAARLASLERSPLFHGTAARHRIRSLRITNILRRDHRYRRIPPLWKLWSSIQTDEDENRRRLDDPNLSQRGMDVLTDVLTSKSLDWLGFAFDPETGAYLRGRASITIQSVEGATLLEIIDPAGKRKVRIVGLASPLRSADQPDPLRSARLIDDWLAKQTEHSALAILHPVDADDILSVARHERSLIDHTGLDTVDSTRTWAVIPATPLLIDSLERVTRFLRWHVTAPIFLQNTIRIRCGDIDRNDRKVFDSLTACRLDGHELVVEKPLSPHERQLIQDIAARRPPDWLKALERLDAVHETLLQCPIYPTHRATYTQFERRDNGTFVCGCRSCRTEWGTNICGSCSSMIPFIKPGKAVPDDDLPNDFFGGDLLASLCEGATAADVHPVDGGPDRRVLICPTCRECSRSSRYANCGRCSRRADSTF